jgi:hypothetical protein
MATIEQIPDLAVGYEEWFDAVQANLAFEYVDMEAWGKNWPYDFRRDYTAGVSAKDSASHALDFWWQELMSESWT